MGSASGPQLGKPLVPASQGTVPSCRDRLVAEEVWSHTSQRTSLTGLTPSKEHSAHAQSDGVSSTSASAGGDIPEKVTSPSKSCPAS